MIDTHCHLNYKGLLEIREKVIEEAKKIMDIIINCAYPEDAKESLELAKKHPGFIYNSMGLHPIQIDKMTDKAIKEYFDFIRANAEEVVAIGEVGLDWHWFSDEDKKDRFRKVFLDCLDLAKELDLPVILHLRKAVDEGYEIVSKEDLKSVVFHAYAGSLTLAKKIIEDHDNYYISVGTNLMRSKNTKKIAAKFPLDRLVTETDSPFLSPFPGKINVPQNVKFVLEKISVLRNQSVGEIDRQIMENCRKIFKI